MQLLWAGIDVSKLLLQICALFSTGEFKEACFENTSAGRKKLIGWLERLGEDLEIRVCLESTGSYHNAIACELSQAGVWVAVLNPRTVKHFAISLNARNKNDLVDARIIARFGKERDPKQWTLADPLRREICQILSHMDRLHKTMRIHQNPLEDSSLPKAVLQSTQRILKRLQHEYERMERRVSELVESHPQLCRVVDAVATVKGVGKATAIQFAARVDIQAFESAEQAATFAGLNPSQRQSGKNQGRTVLSRQGDAALRKAFYFPAITASRYHPKVKEFRDRLQAKNKRWNAIRAACMRKLLMICFGVARRALKGIQPFYAT